MNARTVKTPGPDHPITIEPAPERIRVIWRGKTIADTKAALELREASYPPVYYIPRADVAMDSLARTDHSTYCPYKGDASYFSLADAGGDVANAVWSYEHPYDAVALIADHVAFYPNKVDAIERG